VHAGQNLYLWDKYPLSANVVLHFSVNIINKTSDDDNDGYDDYKYRLDFPIEEIKSVSIAGSTFTEGYRFTKGAANEDSYIQFKTDFIEANKGKTVLVNYVESKVDEPIFRGMHPGPSQSFVFNNKLYIIDGNEYYEYSNGVLRRVTEIAYIPIVYNNITLGDNAPADMRDHENEQMNLLSDKYIHAYIHNYHRAYTRANSNGTLAGCKTGDDASSQAPPLCRIRLHCIGNCSTFVVTAGLRLLHWALEASHQ
jgi:hypothetical protein